MEVARRLKGTGEYYFSQKLREIDALNKAGKDVINLGIGSPDQPPHPDVIRVLQEESAKPHVHAYQGYRGSPVLREAVAAWYKHWYHVTLDAATEILPLIGSKEGIMHICMTYLNIGDKVLVPDPGYPTYTSAVQLSGGKVITYKLREKSRFMPELDKLEKKNLHDVKIMFVNYPHMPTGQLPEKILFEDLVQFARKHDILIVHDNPYSFILNDEPISMLEAKHAKECVIELNSLSKSHNMAGWRLGVMCGSAKHIDNVLRFKSNMDSGMFLPVQLAAAKALSLGSDWHNSVNKIYRERREKVYELLDMLGCRFSHEQAGLFVWAAVPKKYKDGFTLSDDILQHASVFITPGGIFGGMGKGFVRVSLCAPVEKLDMAIERIKKIV